MKKFSYLILILFFVLIWKFVSLASETLPSNKSENVEIPTIILSQSANLESASISAHAKKISQFKSSLNQIFLKLPTIEQLQNNPNYDPHLGDPGISDIADSFGNLVQNLKRDPQFIPAALEFYQACAKKENVILAVRALCLRNLIDWNEMCETKKEISIDSYSEQLQFIAGQLTHTTPESLTHLNDE